MSTIIFLLMIFTPSIVSIYGALSFTDRTANTILESEKRSVTAWPEIIDLRRDFTAYTAQINNYFEDHIIWRKQLIDFALQSKHHLLNVKSNNRAIIGEQDWIFLTSTIVDGLDVRRTPLQPAEEWADNALAIKKHVERYGGTFVIMVPPNKARLYPEFVPKQINYIQTSRFLDELKPFLEQRNIPLVDLLSHLQQYKNQSPETLLYSKTDTHWTHRGALRGYQRTIKELNDLGVELNAVDVPDLKIINGKLFSGDIAVFEGLSNSFYEPLEIFRPSRSFNIFSPKKKLLVFGDSFSGRLADFWRYSFKEAHCYHHNIIKPNLDLIEQVKADVVILQVIERNLSHPLVLDQKKTRTCF